MKIKTIATGGFAAALLAVGVTTVVLTNQKQPQTPQVQGAHTSVEQQRAGYVTFVATKGRNVLDQLKDHASVQTKDSQYGPFVDAINGQKQEGKYWGFYVNGKMAQVGAAAYITQGGEDIEWKLE